MKIKKIVIENWRSIKHIEIEFQKIMLFIGQNNHGKSNVLTAILFFFGNIKHNDLDFNCNSNQLFVEIEFDDLDENDKITFKKYLTANNNIKVRKQAVKGNNAEYHGYLENPEDEWLRESSFSEYNSRDKIVGIPLNDFIPPTGRITKENFTKAIEDFIETNRNSISFNYEIETSPFLGATNIAQGIFGEVFFIPSVKDANTELSLGSKSGSIFNQLYSRVITQISESSPQYKEAKDRIISLMKILNKETEEGTKNDERPLELDLLEKNISEELQTWQTTIDIEITPPNIDDIFKVGASVWVNDGIKTDISRKGHGLQRAMIFALVKSWAKILKEERRKAEEQEQLENEQESSNKGKRKSSNSAYFIFEEPELYLHPQAQRELFYSLVDLSESGNQILLSTHSSFFISLEHYKSICIIKKENIITGSVVKQFLGELFGADEKKNFNLIQWLNPDRSELFFSKKVILLEGETEKCVIPFLAKKEGVFDFNYSIIDCGSKSNIKSYVALLNNFNLTYCAVYDKDHQTGKSADDIATADKESKAIEDSINSVIGKTIVFENDIEEEIGMSDGKKSKPFKALSYVSNDGYQMSATLKLKIKKIFE